MKKKLTVSKIATMKDEGTPISVLTAYDFPSAKFAEDAGIDIILVGDSLGNVVLGYDTTIPVTIEDIIYHSRAVARGATNTFIVADMPFLTYGADRSTTLRNAAQIMQQGGVQALKLEGGIHIAADVKALTDAGVPVMGHIGLTPQAVHQIGGYKIQGKDETDIERLVQDAVALQEAGAFSIVLELVTEPAVEAIKQKVSIPLIGIGAGRGCDGQVLVYHDLIQYADPYYPKKFVKTYANVGQTIKEAIASFITDVKSKAFPAQEHSFHPIATNENEQNEDRLYGNQAPEESKLQ